MDDQAQSAALDECSAPLGAETHPLGEGGQSGHDASSVPRHLVGSSVTAGLLLSTDVVDAGSFLFTACVAPIWIIYAIIKQQCSIRDRSLAWRRIRIIVIVLIMVLGNAWLQTKIAYARSEQVIQACNRYKESTGEYPNKLEELVPAYLPSVPWAKYALMGFFMYHHSRERGTRLSWMDELLFGSRVYYFEEGRWRHLG